MATGLIAKITRFCVHYRICGCIVTVTKWTNHEGLHHVQEFILRQCKQTLSLGYFSPAVINFIISEKLAWG